MSPDQIKVFIEKSYPGIVCERRRSPDGWAFYKGTVQKGSNPTRIARAVQRRPGAPVKFKPAVSARLMKDKGLEVEISGGATQVRELFDRELELWSRHFE
jgi:hypothetical protein